jgi:hypothetical protein
LGPNVMQHLAGALPTGAAAAKQGADSRADPPVG